MTAYVLSPRAQRDIEDIWDYTVDHWNVRQAETYIRQIKLAIETVAAEPKSPDHVTTSAQDIGNIRPVRTLCFFG